VIDRKWAADHLNLEAGCSGNDRRANRRQIIASHGFEAAIRRFDSGRRYFEQRKFQLRISFALIKQ
jgi:hypothetical protein